MPYGKDEEGKRRQREYGLRYRETHREEIKKRKREYYIENWGGIRAKAKERYQENREPALAYRKAHREKNREKDRAHNRKWKAEHPEARRAQWILYRAVKRGTIDRPSFCPRCNKECVPQGHHRDYSEPLEVEWLCARCHRNEHVQ